MASHEQPPVDRGDTLSLKRAHLRGLVDMTHAERDQNPAPVRGASRPSSSAPARCGGGATNCRSVHARPARTERIAAAMMIRLSRRFRLFSPGAVFACGSDCPALPHRRPVGVASTRPPTFSSTPTTAPTSSLHGPSRRAAPGRGRGGSGSGTAGRPAARQGVGAHWPSNVFQPLFAEVDEAFGKLVAHLAPCVLRQADAARVANALESRGDVDAVAQEVAVGLLDDVAEMDSGADLDAPVRRNAGVALGEPPGDVDRAADRFDHAAELDDDPVAQPLDDPPAWASTAGLKSSLRSVRIRASVASSSAPVRRL